MSSPRDDLRIQRSADAVPTQGRRRALGLGGASTHVHFEARVHQDARCHYVRGRLSAMYRFAENRIQFVSSKGRTTALLWTSVGSGLPQLTIQSCQFNVVNPDVID